MGVSDIYKGGGYVKNSCVFFETPPLGLLFQILKLFLGGLLFIDLSIYLLKLNIKIYINN